MNEVKNFRGNYGSHFYHLGTATQGVGSAQHLNPMGWCSCHGENTSFVIPGGYITATKEDQGTWFQAVGCEITIEFTLESVPYSVQESRAESMHWCNAMTLTPGTIIESPIKAFSAIRITFNGRGIFYAAAR